MTTIDNTTELMQRASDLLDNSQFVPALELYKRIIELDPLNAEAWLMKGAISGETGQVDEAISSLNQAIQINPSYTTAHLTLGNIQQAIGHTAEAVSSFHAAVTSNTNDFDANCQLANALATSENYTEALKYALKATELDHKHAAAWHLLGWLQQRLGKLDNAEQSYKEALIITPENTKLHSELGMLLIGMRKHQDSIKYLEYCLAAHPEDTDIQNSLGVAFMGIGNLSEAENHFQQALAIAPNLSSTHANLGILLQYSGQLHTAQQHLEKAIELDPNRSELHYQLAGVLSGLGEYDTASNYCKKAEKLDPNNTNAIAGRADIEQRRGNYQAAYELIRPLLDSKPANIQAMLIYSSIGKHLENKNDSTTLLESIIQAKECTQRDKIQIYNALGKSYDHAGKYEQAIESFNKSNAAKQSKYNPAEHEQLIGNIIDTFTLADATSGITSGIKSDSLVFIVGVPRSGTTLVEQILASHSEVSGEGEFIGVTKQLRQLPETSLVFPDYMSELDATMAASMAEHILNRVASIDSSATRVVINERSSYLYIGLISRLFPEAKFIHCVRNPLDTCLSCYFQLLTNEHDYSYKLEHLGHYYTQYQRLMQHWKKMCSGSILEVSYEDLVNTQEETTRSLVNFCDLNWESACLRFYENRRNVVTPSYDDVHQPIYKTSVSRWKNYEPYIQQLRSSLND